ncbi:MAG: hypothetical protein ACXWFO_04405, partial [Candidatus Aminicenantales bacterium]
DPTIKRATSRLSRRSRTVRRIPNILLPSEFLGLAFFQAGCQSDLHSWVPPEDHKVKIISDAASVRTSQGE